MPSVYQRCTIDDEATEALNTLKQYLENEVRQTFNQQLATVETALNDLLGDPVAASVTIGSTIDNQIKWTAKQAGRQGNQINISYVYLGPAVDTTTTPATLNPRLPGAAVDGNTITLYLSSDVSGVISANAATDLTFWNNVPDVAALVEGTLVGAGTDSNEPTGATYLAGGKDRSVTATENAADGVAKTFSQPTYQELMRGVDIPVIETEADLAAYIQSEDEYTIVNGKLLIIDGTNLVAINKIYEKTGNNLQRTKEILAGMQVALPTMLTTQNVTTTTYQNICGVTQPISTVAEMYRNIDTNINTTAATYGGDVTSLHHYIFWPEQVKTTQAAYDKLVRWGIPEDYIGEILSGDDAVQEDYLDEQAPEVDLVESLTLLDDLLFTDAELEELLQLQVDGVKIPHKVPMSDRVEALTRLLTKKPTVQSNGTTNKVKSPIVALQAVDVSKLTDDQNLSKELSTRGKACARSESRLSADNINGFEIPGLSNLDLPNLPFDQLPDPAKKIESAYGALSSGISFANRIFDVMVGSLTKTVSSILNKVQNVASLTDNLFGNDLAQCLLGTGTANTGAPDLPAVGSGGGNSLPDLSGILGGLPLPTDLLKEAFKSLSIELDETITDAFEAMMKTIQVPLCIVQKLLGSLTGFDLGGLLNPCKDASSPDLSCPPATVQSIIDASTDLTGALSTIPSLEDAPTTLPTETVEETVQQFTGSIKETVTSTTDEVTRGIKEVMEELGQSVEAKIELVDQFDKAIKELFGDVQDTKETIDEDAETNSSCFPSPLGALTDAIEDFI